MIDITKHPEYDNHELVSFFFDKKTGLRGIIAIHSTILGPAVGGTRYFNYKTESEALDDVLRLSRGMTYKCAISKAHFGGGKAVIIADPKKKKTKEYLKAYAKQVNRLNGLFFTGEDVGMSMNDIKVLIKESPFIIGNPKKAGDPSPWAALGVFYAIEQSLEIIDKKRGLAGYTVAIKGLGKVGMELARLLYKQGVILIGADVDILRNKEFLHRFPGSKIVPVSEIHKQKVDVYSPCALGKEFNKKTINQLKCRVVCGSANNQLVDPKDGLLLYKRNIIYITDYLANAGGLINVIADLNQKKYSKKTIQKNVFKIKATVKEIIALSRKNKQPTNIITDLVAEQFILKNKKNN
ncbi:MAG: Glu/Leu/Phe/Val dehydrogenase dimerization domain-containing protein [Candidatus Paceibacterota bacterium]